MNVSKYSKRSRWSHAVWTAAANSLKENGFTDAEADPVLRLAHTSRRNPQGIAQVAIRLRKHVEAGCPI